VLSDSLPVVGIDGANDDGERPPHCSEFLYTSSFTSLEFRRYSADRGVRSEAASGKS
jgi:hypothetical protein